jgi:hypothetical protein
MWYRFEWPEAIQDAIARDGVVGLVGGLTMVFSDGCGVSGFDESDCLALVREQLFNGEELPETCDRVPDVDVSTLRRICKIISGIRRVEVSGFRR